MRVTPCPLLGALLAGCGALANVLPVAHEDELALPLPEDCAPARWSGLPERPASFRLACGLTVVLLADHDVQRVALDTRLGVGTRDEGTACGGWARRITRTLSRSAAALLEEVERGGGTSRIGTGADHTTFLGTGPAALLPALVALEAARFAALETAVDERDDRDALDQPCDAGEVGLNAALHPEGHPYRFSARADDSTRASADGAAFRALYAPSNATLVVAGDFDPARAKLLVERAFGALPEHAVPPRTGAPPLALERERHVRLASTDGFARLCLAWHSPPEHAPLDAELALLAAVLAEGPASRLERRLVFEQRLAQAVDAGQRPAELGSVFLIEAVAEPGVDLEAIKSEILATLDDVRRDGPTPDELARARARQVARFQRRMEGLLARTAAVQAYLRAFGTADGFERDLARWTGATREGVRDAARAVLGPGRVDLRLVPDAEVMTITQGAASWSRDGLARSSSVLPPRDSASSAPPRSASWMFPTANTVASREDSRSE